VGTSGVLELNISNLKEGFGTPAVSLRRADLIPSKHCQAGALKGHDSHPREIIKDHCLVVVLRSLFYVVRIPHVALFTDFGLEP
jgi:hypothetical protein